MVQSDFFEYLKGDTPTKNILFICKDEKEAKKSCDIAQFLGFNAFALPDIRASFGEDLRAYQQEIFELTKNLYYYYNCKDRKKILISPIRTLLTNLPKKDFFSKIELEFAQSINLKELKERLFYFGYNFVDIVTQKGEVSIRGDIIDIFPINSQNPYRVLLFGDEVESIRRFEVESQKSIKEELEVLEIAPAKLALTKEQFREWESRALDSEFDIFEKDLDSVGLWTLGELGENYLEKFNPLYISNLKEEIEEIYSLTFPKVPKERLLSIKTIPKAKEYRDIKNPNINLLIKTHRDKKITVIAKNSSQVRGSNLEDIQNINFIYQDGVINLISKEELILSLNRPSNIKRVKRASIVLDELNIGDFVVHENYGVGVFRGIEKRRTLGSTREFVVIEYQNEDRLLIPVESLDVIDRFIADSGLVPVIDKMGKGGFKRLKQKLRERLFEIASEIIDISAKRHLKRGVILDIDRKEHKEFIESAGFIYTPDQKRAIEEIVADFRSGNMMDRLLSGDVGFGKSEIAMNAIFIAYKNSYQSIFIAPTTILSSQHYKSLKERFKNYDIKIAKVDRFTPAKEKKAIFKGLEEGDIDVVVGTHALLKAKFKNLGLIIIDEEHKFGVKQKEQLKEISLDAHLLSMSATPIPRTLNMALSQIKSFSELLTPPDSRKDVKTFVKEFNPQIIKEAILREKRRGGQSFYIFNSIANIESKKEVLQELIPNLKIEILHSKVTPKETEKIMLEFEEGKIDLLLSTSIIESGIHLPRVNTIIIDGADRFGMADLHQLRGRVGRGGREGYCYLFIEDKEALSENAKKRLLALEKYSALGSGAVLAFYDLEIRGGGNILGKAQSGHIKQVGYALYLKMLEDAIRELTGSKKREKLSIDINLSVNAYLNEELIGEDRLRLELYRRLSQVESLKEIYEIASEIEDRFGKLDRITSQFIDIVAIKTLAKEKNITKIENLKERIFIEYIDSTRVEIKAFSRDEEDIIEATLNFLKNVASTH